MVALAEHAAVGVQPLHLAQRPVHVVVVAALEDPVHREVRAEVGAAEEVGVGAEPQVLQRPGGDEAPPGEQPRARPCSPA